MAPSLSPRQLKAGYFVVEGLNAWATSYYFNYLFFYLQSRHGFGDYENLLVCALNGLVYMGASWYCGRLAQRYGYLRSLRFGLGLMAVMLVMGASTETTRSLLLVTVVWTVGVCFTWPALEALVSEDETAGGLPRVIGVYNLVWAAGSALAYFSGGALLETLGTRSLFYLPAGVHLAMLGLVAWLERHATRAHHTSGRFLEFAPLVAPREDRSVERARLFMRLAWLANPFAYVAINTIVAVIPGLAKRHELSPMLAGFFCSVWFFARLGAFLGLWLWTAWHYRFRWFVCAYLLLTASFCVILLSQELWTVVMAQVVFGLATGLIYYSSLFYSMDVGETKGEHGGIHEAAIGAGIFGGPAAGAAALHLFPGRPHASVWAVSGLLLVGLGAFLWVRWRAGRTIAEPGRTDSPLRSGAPFPRSGSGLG